MRRYLSLAALLAFGCILDTSSAALEVVPFVRASANGFDTRTSGYGCAPYGCVPGNVLNDSIADESRWSCRPSVSGLSTCTLTLTFSQPQDIVEARIARYKGDQRRRNIRILVLGTSSWKSFQTTPTTLEYVPYELSGTQVMAVLVEGSQSVEGVGTDSDVWFSMTGIQVMIESEVEVFPAVPAPTSEDYVGCFNDMLGDRVLSTVKTDAALTLEVCAAKCGEIGNTYYGLQQGNECWCAGCEISDHGTNTDFDRHGDGTCYTPCAGDATTACGGDMAISLYQSATCVTTPAPTPAVPASDCPSGSTEAALHIVATSRGSVYGDFHLYVVEPGGTGVIVSDVIGPPHCDRGDVGVWAKSGDGGLPSNETLIAVYVTMNGLNVTEDAVLGDYEIWGTAYYGTEWTITARSNGELLWIKGGMFADYQEETERFVATVTSYADSDCKNDNYGQCPPQTFSFDGFPPCTNCPEGVVSRVGSTFCTDPALRHLRLPENIANAIVADASAGWAGPGGVQLYDGEHRDHLVVAEGEELGTITLSGNFEKRDSTALGSSTALFLYIDTEGSESDFVRGQGEIELDSGNFTATIADLPVGYSEAILSFVVLDPADAGFGSVSTAFTYDVVNEGCSQALRIKLEGDSDLKLDLWVTDPNGNRVSSWSPSTDIGYINNRNGGDYSGNPDTGNTSSFEEYVLFSGLSGDAMLGEYRVFARTDYYSTEPTTSTAWTLTATIGGVVEWVEEGVFSLNEADGSYDSMDGDGASSRRLDGVTYFTEYSYHDDYSATRDPQTDTFTVNLDVYDPVRC